MHLKPFRRVVVSLSRCCFFNVLHADARSDCQRMRWWCEQGEESVPPGPQASAEALSRILDHPESPDWLWIVDPIDGTTNFVHGMPLSAISIGASRPARRHRSQQCMGQCARAAVHIRVCELVLRCKRNDPPAARPQTIKHATCSSFRKICRLDVLVCCWDVEKKNFNMSGRHFLGGSVFRNALRILFVSIKPFCKFSCAGVAIFVFAS